MSTVKVIYSPGYGVGLWGSKLHHRLDAEAIALVEAGNTEGAMLRLAGLTDEPGYFFDGGQELAIKEVPVGMYWRIEEYDGYESVEIFTPGDWNVA